MSASEYRNNMLRAFKTKGEKSESNDFLVTYFYILMASTYMWLIFITPQFMKLHQHVRITAGMSILIKSQSKDPNFLNLTTGSFRKHIRSLTFSSINS